MSALNPFWHGTPVPLEKFIGRDEKLRSITSRISTGQSIAISGSPRGGKTSILDYLMAPEKQVELYGDDANKFIFSYLDATMWDDQFDKAKFWREALASLGEYIQDNADTLPALVKAYQTCQENEFGTFVLEKLFAQLKQINKRLVLVVDGFDFLLQCPLLKNSAEFFGGLRSVASHSGGALVIIITINIPITHLTEKVQDFTRSGSPYFNFMDEVILGPLSSTEIDKLLGQASGLFTAEESALVKKMAGGHPYLLQVIASCLWELYETHGEEDSKQRQQLSIKDFYLKVAESLERIWHSWQLTTQQTMMAVTFVQLDKLKGALRRQGINTFNIGRQIPRFKSELESLKKQGFVMEDERIAGGWRIYPEIFLHFIIDKKLELKYREELPPVVWKTLLTPDFG